MRILPIESCQLHADIDLKYHWSPKSRDCRFKKKILSAFQEMTHILIFCIKLYVMLKIILPKPGDEKLELELLLGNTIVLGL